MSISTVEQKIRTPEEIAAIEKERARQKAIFADAKAEAAKEREEKENRFQKALAHRKEEVDKPTFKKEAQIEHKGVVFTREQIAAIQQNALDEIENSNPRTDQVVEYISTSEGEFLPSIPSFSLDLDEPWEGVSMIAYQPEITQLTNGLMEVVQSERSLQAVLDKRDNGDIHVELSDLNDRYPQTRIKLSGTLRYENGRMTYRKDEDVFFHYSSLVMTDQNLTNLSTVITTGETREVTRISSSS